LLFYNTCKNASLNSESTVCLGDHIRSRAHVLCVEFWQLIGIFRLTNV